jgi:hypothetical protein
MTNVRNHTGLRPPARTESAWLRRYGFRGFGPGLGHGRGYDALVQSYGARDGSHRIRRKLQRNDLLAEVHVEVSKLLREAPTRIEPSMAKSKLPGEPEALRGIPAVSRNVRGAIRGTDPEGETVRRLSRNGR